MLKNLDKSWEVVRLYERFNSLMASEPISIVFQKLFDKLFVYTSYPLQKIRFRQRSFSIFDTTLTHFIHHYNATWRNERCIEISVANYFLNQWGKINILELGNVMSYYRNNNHVVVDKYEKTKGVINEDFLTYNPNQTFDGFISISTIEHIGWDEPQKDTEKISKCLQKISTLITNKDNVLVSFPLGYNDYLDALVRQGQLPFKKQACLIRNDKNQNWQEVSPLIALDKSLKYGAKFLGANACFFGLGIR